MSRVRFTLLAATAGLLATLACAAAAPAQGPVPAQATPLRVYVIVLDGLQSGEVGPLTPNLAALQREGTWYEEARAVFPAETLPNHASMMTGVAPQRSGIIGNDWWPGNATKERMENPRMLDAPTLTTRLENQCPISTATVQSKSYLFRIFRGTDYVGPPHWFGQIDVGP